MSHAGRRPGRLPVGPGAASVGRSRHFVALRPDPASAATLAALARRIARETGGRPLDGADIHLTLAFIGPWPDALGARLARLLASVRHTPGTAAPLRIDRIGHFGRRAKPALYWAGPARTPEWLATLSDDVRAALRAGGVEFDARRLVPHLTLVRQARPPAGFEPPPLEPALRIRHWRLALGRSLPAGSARRYAWRDAGARHRTVKQAS